MFKRRDAQSLWERWRQFLWPREGWGRAFLYMWWRAGRSNASAHSVALGLATGAFASASPLLGMHIVYAWLLCWMFSGNYLAAALGTWVGNPASFPFIWISTYSLGNSVLGAYASEVAFPALSVSLFWEAPFAVIIPIIGPMLIGSLPVGLALAVVTYYPSYWLIRAYQKRRHSMRRKNNAKITHDKM